MKKHFYLFAALMTLIFSAQAALSQPFSIENYKNFLKDNKDLTAERLYGIYPVGKYKAAAKPQSSILYLDSATMKLNLTSDELRLLGTHGFMVSERLSHKSMWEALEKVWHDDLPVFITSDAILHSIHMSYDAILKDIEKTLLIPKLDDALRKMHEKLPALAEQYIPEGSENPTYEIMRKSINDVDVYLTVARKMLSPYSVNPVFIENFNTVKEIQRMILDETAESYKLFSENERIIDFSQFTVRGHYTQSPELGRYFKSMIWLGRTELYLIKPKSDDCKQTPEDIQRQIIDAALIVETADVTGANDILDQMNRIIEAMVGESDNVQMMHIRELLDEAGISSVLELADMDNITNFQDKLKTKPYADQKILSQILISNDFTSPDKIEPASAFMLLGQRFIIDSYVTGNVVFDKIYYNGEKICRLLPSSLDVLFALGNNAASDLLKPELEQYKYGSNLAAMRYLIDSYNSDFWTSSVYNSWLGSIRSLNPLDEAERGKLPKFMQTAAWWQQKMNTQLASWAQLRHDNLLYAKQSYTGGTSCSYPFAYVEPEPDFYKSCGVLAQTAKSKMESFLSEEDPDPTNQWMKQRISAYFDRLLEVSEKLENIANKELLKDALTDEETNWIKSIFSTQPNCGEPLAAGWYAELFYNESDDVKKQDNVIADVHTAPTDCDGNMVGYVWHIGTGDINLAVMVTENGDGQQTAYVGPVMSYLENVSLNFKRLTDEEWKEMYAGPDAMRPAFTKLYLADKDGNSDVANPPRLPVDAESGAPEEPVQNSKINAVPNPFSESTILTFDIPSGAGNSVQAWVCDLNGKRIKTLFEGIVPAGNFSLRWDGTDETGTKQAKGMYFYNLNIDGKLHTGKVVLK